MTRLATLVWHLYLVTDPVTVPDAVREMDNLARYGAMHDDSRFMLGCAG